MEALTVCKRQSITEFLYLRIAIGIGPYIQSATVSKGRLCSQTWLEMMYNDVVLLSSDSYANNAKRLSNLYRDQLDAIRESRLLGRIHNPSQGSW